MRPIKFRAWDKEKKEMISGWEATHKGACGWRNDETGSHIVLGNDLLELMQFTGLLDKNGKEIYFGDILATSNSDENYDLWNKEHYGYTIVEEDSYQLGIRFSKWYMTYDTDSIYHFRFCEIIGNIYENPELLNQCA